MGDFNTTIFKTIYLLIQNRSTPAITATAATVKLTATQGNTQATIIPIPKAITQLPDDLFLCFSFKLSPLDINLCRTELIGTNFL